MNIIRLSQAGNLTCGEIGGKACGLAKMLDSGLPVPDGWVVPAGFFRGHLARHNLAKIAACVLADPQSKTCLEMQKMITGSAMDDGLEALLNALPDIPLAIRSSASVEDGDNASYSGLFATVLGVKGKAAVCQAVKKVWASAFNVDALVYHRQFAKNGYPMMAVLIMPLIHATVFGIAFSVNPLDGNPFQIAVSACYGLGTTAVQGKETCDQSIYSWHTLEKTEFRIGCQKTGEYCNDDGIIEIRPIPLNKQNKVKLNTKNARQLASLVRDMDRLFGERVDVEFALCGNDMHILQARKVVGIPPYFPGNPLGVLPGIVCPHFQFTSPLSPFTRARMAIDFKPHFPQPPWPPEITETFLLYGRAFGKIPVNPEYREHPESPWDDRSFLKRMMNLNDPGEEYLEWYKWSEHVYSDTIPAIRADSEILLRYSAAGLAAMSHSGLKELLVRALQTESEAWAFYISASGSTYESVRRLEILIKDWLSMNDSRILQDMAMTMIQGAVKLTHLRDAELAAVARNETNITDFICHWGYSYVYREENLDVAYWKSWRENPVPLHLAVDLMRKQLDSCNIQARINESVQKREERLAQAFISIEASHLVEGKKRAEIFRACVQASMRHFPLKDDRDLVLSHAQSALRWILMAVGKNLVRSGVLTFENDILLLTPDEILEILSGRDSRLLRIPNILHARRIGQENDSRLALTQRTTVKTPACKADGQLLQGFAASPGTATGTARIVSSIRDIENMQPGNILCLKGGGRLGWTIYFPLISGFVFEDGNWLCHEANLCRELGIPAVVALEEKMNLISDGDTIRIDGGRGTVQRIVNHDSPEKRINDTGKG